MTAQAVPPSPESPIDPQTRLHREKNGLAEDILSSERSSITQLPAGYPPRIDHRSSWSGLGSDETHFFRLDVAAILEIEKGLRSSHKLERNGDEVTRASFPLPHLRDSLDKCALEVHDGSGLCIVRGLNPEKYTVEDNIVLFLAIAGYIGDERGLQNSQGDMLSHVTESKSWTIPREKRHGIHTNYSLPFHNDMGCEILAIQVRDRADEGGHTCVASMAAIYNDLVQTKPWVLHVLARHDWPIQAKEPPFALCPLIEYHAGRLLVSMDPARIGPHPSNRNGSIPDLRPEQREALAMIQEAAQKHQVRLDTRLGDLVFINNLAFLHGRESYLDGDATSRHLVRLWLRNTRLGWAIPPSMSMPWDAVFGEGAKKMTDKRYPIMPMPEYFECKYTNGTAAFLLRGTNDERAC
ncbi:Clavaminate synthase-like protein [Daldinia sp. FL1419]|nr:Clavaminate synthase-like protein [Daldinia sp. FL1419]